MANKNNDNWILWAAGGLIGALALIFGPKLLNNNTANTNPSIGIGNTEIPLKKKDCGCQMKK